jgi:RNA polymerase sigma factor (sigma-70 family)
MERAVPDLIELVRAAAAGDHEAWNALVSRFNGLVWSVARAHRLPADDAADVVQVTWLRLVEHLDRVTDPERLGAWLATVARRESLKALRLGARHIPTPEEELPDSVLDAPVEERLLASERSQLLWRAFAGLRSECRALLRMLAADPAPSYREVSAALAMPVGSIGPTRARCLEQLRSRAVAAGLPGVMG